MDYISDNRISCSVIGICNIKKADGKETKTMKIGEKIAFLVIDSNSSAGGLCGDEREQNKQPGMGMYS